MSALAKPFSFLSSMLQVVNEDLFALCKSSFTRRFGARRVIDFRHGGGARISVNLMIMIGLGIQRAEITCRRVDTFHSTTSESKAAQCGTDIHQTTMKFFLNLLIVMVACSWCDQEFKNVHGLAASQHLCSCTKEYTKITTETEGKNRAEK
jgi:hypothetical protein